MVTINSESLNPDSALEQARSLDNREIPCTPDTDIITQQAATAPCETSQIDASTLRLRSSVPKAPTGIWDNQLRVAGASQTQHAAHEYTSDKDRKQPADHRRSYRHTTIYYPPTNRGSWRTGLRGAFWHNTIT